MSVIGIRMDHVVEVRDPTFIICNQREVQSVAGDIFDVLQPGAVTLQWIDTEADDLGVAAVELWLQRGNTTKLGRANRSEVSRMGEQDGPAAFLPIVKVELALGRLSGEVRGRISESDRNEVLRFMVPPALPATRFSA